MFSLTKAWHWVAVHAHNFVVGALAVERYIVQNRAKIEQAEQTIANDIGSVLAMADPAASVALLKIIPGFSAAFAKCLEGLAKIDAAANPGTMTIEYDPDFIQHLQNAAMALESVRPGSTTPPASLTNPATTVTK